MPSLHELIAPELIFPGLEGSTGGDILREMAGRLAACGRVADAGNLHQKLLEREELGPTAVGHGVAIPHCKLNGLDNVVVAIGVAREGVDFGAQDGQPVRLFFVVASPNRAPAAHLQSLALISKWVKSAGAVERILDVEDPDEIYSLIRQEG